MKNYEQQIAMTTKGTPNELAMNELGTSGITPRSSSPISLQTGHGPSQQGVHPRSRAHHNKHITLCLRRRWKAMTSGSQWTHRSETKKETKTAMQMLQCYSVRRANAAPARQQRNAMQIDKSLRGDMCVCVYLPLLLWLLHIFQARGGCLPL